MVSAMKKYFLSFLLIIFVQSVSAQTIKLALDWFVNPNHAPIILAQELGYFKEQELEVEILTPADPADPPKWVAATKADIAIDYEPHFKVEVENGLPLKKIGSLIDSPLTCMISLKENNINNLKDIKDKRVGYSVSGAESMILKKMLSHVGLTEKDIVLVSVRYGLLQALLSKQVDVVMGAMRNVEVPELEMLGKKVNTFYPEDFGVEKYAELIFVANENDYDKEVVRKFVTAIKKGKKYLRENPDASWVIFSEKLDDVNKGLNKKIWLETIRYF